MATGILSSSDLSALATPDRPLPSPLPQGRSSVALYGISLETEGWLILPEMPDAPLHDQALTFPSTLMGSAIAGKLYLPHLACLQMVMFLFRQIHSSKLCQLRKKKKWIFTKSLAIPNLILDKHSRILGGWLLRKQERKCSI